MILKFFPEAGIPRKVQDHGDRRSHRRGRQDKANLSCRGLGGRNAAALWRHLTTAGVSILPSGIVRLVEIRNPPGLLGLGYCYIAGSGITRRSRGASGKLRQTVVPRPGVDVIVSVPA